MEYRRRIKALRDEGNTIFAKSQAEKRTLDDGEKRQIEAINGRIDSVEQEMDHYIKLNGISPEALRSDQMRPDVGDHVPDRKKEKRAAFFKGLRDGRAALNKEERSLVEDASGLLMVPEDLEAQIYRSLPQLNVIRQLATVRTTTRDKVRRRSLTELSVGWGKLETGALITESNMTPTQDYIYVEDLYGITKVGEDELQDTDASLEAVIADSFARAIADAEAKAFVIGTGHTYSQPDGVTLDATVISTYTDLDTADTMVPDDLIDLEYALPAGYQKGASFMLHPSTELMVRKVKGTSAPYYWQPSLMVGMPRQFDGFPVYNSSDLIVPASTNTDRSIVGLFGDWKAGYVIVDRLGITLQRLSELYAESGLVGFKVHFRVGGGVVRPDAFRALDNNT